VELHPVQHGFQDDDCSNADEWWMMNRELLLCVLQRGRDESWWIRYLLESICTNVQQPQFLAMCLDSSNFEESQMLGALVANCPSFSL
jgi:hypothetical protein